MGTKLTREAAINIIRGKEDKPSNVESIGGGSLALLNIYYEVALRQAQWVFFVAVVLAVLGTSSILVSAAQNLFGDTTPRQDPAGLGIIGGTVVDVISGLVFVLHNRVVSQFDHFHARLAKLAHFVMAVAIAEGITDLSKKDEALSKVACAVASWSDALPPLDPGQVALLSSAPAPHPRED